jgi:hypothetical protein
MFLPAIRTHFLVSSLDRHSLAFVLGRRHVMCELYSTIMSQPDPSKEFASLLQRLAAANYNVAISGNFNLPAEQEALLDALTPIPGSEDTGIVCAGSTWDGVVCVEVRLADLGYLPRQLEAVAKMIDENPSDQVLVVEALLCHLIPFQRWVTILDAKVWHDAVGGGSNDEIDVAISEKTIDLRFHATRIAKMLKDELAAGAAEAEE